MQDFMTNSSNVKLASNICFDLCVFFHNYVIPRHGFERKILSNLYTISIRSTSALNLSVGRAIVRVACKVNKDASIKCVIKSKKSKFHYACSITPKRVTSGGAHFCVLALGKHSFKLQRMVATMASRWRRCV